jgi:hypothetical protein
VFACWLLLGDDMQVSEWFNYQEKDPY